MVRGFKKKQHLSYQDSYSIATDVCLHFDFSLGSFIIPFMILLSASFLSPVEKALFQERGVLPHALTRRENRALPLTRSFV